MCNKLTDFSQLDSANGVKDGWSNSVSITTNHLQCKYLATNVTAVYRDRIRTAEHQATALPLRMHTL